MQLLYRIITHVNCLIRTGKYKCLTRQQDVIYVVSHPLSWCLVCQIFKAYSVKPVGRLKTKLAGVKGGYLSCSRLFFVVALGLFEVVKSAVTNGAAWDAVARRDGERRHDRWYEGSGVDGACVTAGLPSWKLLAGRDLLSRLTFSNSWKMYISPDGALMHGERASRTVGLNKKKIRIQDSERVARGERETRWGPPCAPSAAIPDVSGCRNTAQLFRKAPYCARFSPASFCRIFGTPLF